MATLNHKLIEKRIHSEIEGNPINSHPHE